VLTSVLDILFNVTPPTKLIDKATTVVLPFGVIPLGILQALIAAPSLISCFCVTLAFPFSVEAAVGVSLCALRLARLG